MKNRENKKTGEITEERFKPSKDFNIDDIGVKDIELEFDEDEIEEVEPNKSECDAGCKLSKGINSKLGFSNWICRAGDKTCKRNNIILILALFFIVWGIFYTFLKYTRPKIILDNKGYLIQKKLIMYSFLFGLLGPVLYLTYILITA